MLEHGIPREGESAFGPHGPPSTPSKQAPNWQRVQKALSEGIIYDCVGILSDAETFFTAHDPHGHLDVLCDRTCRELLGLACRGVVREWHAELPQWGAFAEGGGEADVDMRAKVARRLCFILCAAATRHQFVSFAEPEGLNLATLPGCQSLVHLGCVFSDFHLCNFGSPLRGKRTWLHNKPWALKLAGDCKCLHPQPHFSPEGEVFSCASAAAFAARCQPSCREVFGVDPSPGGAISPFATTLPLPFLQGLAAGSAAAKDGYATKIPAGARKAAAQRVGLFVRSAACFCGRRLRGLQPSLV